MAVRNAFSGAWKTASSKTTNTPSLNRAPDVFLRRLTGHEGFRTYVDFFYDLGFSKPQIATLFAAQPSIFKRDIDTFLAPLVDFYLSTLKIDKAAFPRVVTSRRAQLLTLDLRGNLQPKVLFFLKLFPELAQEQVLELLRAEPLLLCSHVFFNIAPKLALLRAFCAQAR